MSVDNGDNWFFIGKGLSDTAATSDICFGKNNTAYLGTYSDGVFKSNDFGLYDDFTDNKNELKIYPNPANDEATFYIKSEIEESVKIRVYDLCGNAIRDYLPFQNNGQHPFTIKLNDVSTGVYYIMINIGTKNFYSRLIITHYK